MPHFCGLGCLRSTAQQPSNLMSLTIFCSDIKDIDETLVCFGVFSIVARLAAYPSCIWRSIESYSRVHSLG